MDASGANNPEAQQGSDDATDEQLCEQCQESGLSAVASAFCTTCNDFLCGNCVEQHKKLRSSKNHKLLEGADIPKQKPGDASGLECSEHPGEIIKLVCQSDDELGCVLCMTESHRACSDVTSISKLSKGIDKSEELEDIKQSAGEQKEIFDSCRKLIDEYRRLNGKWYDGSVDSFEKFKNTIKECIERLGKNVYAEAGNMKQANEQKLKSFEESLRSVEQGLDSVMTKIDLHEATKQMDQLYISIKKSTEPIRENRENVDQLKEEINIERYIFGVDTTIQQSLEKMISTGPMKELSGDVQCVWEIKTQLQDDDETCKGGFLVKISPSTVVFGDVENKCLKLFDVDSGTLVEKRELESLPIGIALIPDNRIAVCFPEKKQIQFFNRSHLEPRECLDVDGECVCIATTDKAMVVSYVEPKKVEILDFSGNVLKSFSADADGTQLFTELGAIGIDERNTHIYVGGRVSGDPTVTCLSGDGSVLWRYEDDELREPLGIATAHDGCIYVANKDRNNVNVISPNGIKLAVISLDSESPYSMWSCEEDNNIYVVTTPGRDDEDGTIKCLKLE